MKTIDSMIEEARARYNMWEYMANDHEDLKARKKSREEALYLANYFEGRFEALLEAKKRLGL